MPTGAKLPPGPLTRAIAKILSDLADEKGISQAAIGRQNVNSPMYISQSQVSRFFAQAKGIDVDQLGGLCKILGVNVIDVIEEAEGDGGNVTPFPTRTNVSRSTQTASERRAARKKARDRGEDPQ